MSYEHTNEEYRGHTLKIVSDDDPMHSRRDCDPFGVMVCWSRDYYLGDEPLGGNSENGEDWTKDQACEFEPSLYDTLEWWETEGYERIVAKLKNALIARFGSEYLLVHEDIRNIRRQASEIANKKSERAIEKALQAHVAVMLPLYFSSHGCQCSMWSGSECYDWDDIQVGWIYITKEELRKEQGWKRITKKRKEKVTAWLEGEVKAYNQYLEGDVWGYIVEHESGWSESCWGFYGTDYCEAEAKSIIDWHCEELEREKIEEYAELAATAI